jgi:phosphoglycerate dehydrogenase-like enzyme
VTRRLVVDLRAQRPVWRVTPEVVARVREALGAGWEVVEVAAPASSDGDGGAGGSSEAVAAVRGAEVYLGFGLPAGVVAAARAGGTLRWIHTCTAGVGAGLGALRENGIQLTNSAGIHAEPIADWVVAAIAHFARGLDYIVRAQAERHWIQSAFGERAIPVRELGDVRLGILGLGGIGSAVARRGLALGMRVAGVRRRPARGGPPGTAWVGGEADLERLAAESDVLVIAAPRTSRTQGMVGADVLGRLPAGAVIVNVSRGALLDEGALLEGLDAGRLRGAALDVFSVEPLPADNPLWTHPRVLVSPHASPVTDRFWERETGLILENIRRYLAGTPLANLVDADTGY